MSQKIENSEFLWYNINSRYFRNRANEIKKDKFAFTEQKRRGKEKNMIYQKTHKHKDLFDKDVFRKAERNLEFRNRRGEVFSIEENTVFTVDAEYLPRTDDYNVTIRSYEFANVVSENMMKGSDSPLAVQSIVEQRMTEDEFFILENDIEAECLSMKKSVLEYKILNHEKVREYCKESSALRKQYLDAKAQVDNTKALLAQDSRDPTNIEKKMDGLIRVASEIEADPTVEQVFRFINQMVFGISSMVMLTVLGSTTGSPDLLFLTLLLIAPFVSGMNLLLKPVKAAELFCKILSLPFVLSDLLTGTKTNRISRSLRLSLESQSRSEMEELHLNELKQKQLKEKLNIKFCLINDEIFRSALLTTTDQNGQITEIETRTPEEIAGGCERVMYPVFGNKGTSAPSAHNNADNYAMPGIRTAGAAVITDDDDDHDQIQGADGRKVISLSKKGRRSAAGSADMSSAGGSRRKVDLRKH